MALNRTDAARMMEGYESPGDPPENKLEARDGADSPKPTEAGPATPDLPGDAGDAVAELRAQVAELSRIGSGLQDDMDAVLDLVSELVQGCEGLIREQRQRDELAARSVEVRGKGARQRSEDAILDSVRQLTERNAKYLEERTKEATRMVERLGRVTLPDKALRFVTLAVLVMLAALLGHLCWQAFLA